MKYLKLWKYALCLFYVSLAPYIIMSALIFNTIGCSVNQELAEKKAYDKLKTEQERNRNCQALADCLGAKGNLGYSQEDEEWNCSIFKNNPHFFIGFRESSLVVAVRTCNMKGRVDETSKLSRTKESTED